ncbi:hypothetical protein J6590_045408 [Homalodisca vitripennis]|nr:hypothetical protein J6590_045408 [Homalodisca vitripennis]
MTTTSVLFCLAALLTIYSHAAGSINCRPWTYEREREDLPQNSPDSREIRNHASKSPENPPENVASPPSLI